MRRVVRAVMVVALVLAAGGWPAISQPAGDPPIGYRAVNLNDFQGQVPPDQDRVFPAPDGNGTITAGAQASTGIFSNYTLTAGEGGQTLSAVGFRSLFDPTQSWFDRTTPAADQAALLRHEQAHFDISEGFVQTLNGQAQAITAEVNARIRSDEALRQSLQETQNEMAAARQSIINATRELNDPATTPERAGELQLQIAEQQERLATQRNAQEALLRGASPTWTAIARQHDQQQDAYDAETGHGTDPTRQAEWEERARDRLFGWPTEPPRAGSRAANSLSFDAETRTLAITDDVLVSVGGVATDPVIGAELVLPPYVLTGRTVFDAPIFSAVDGRVSLVQGEDTLLTATLRTLFYSADEGRFFGVLNDPVRIAPEGYSRFLDLSLGRLSEPGGGLLTLDLFPEGGSFADLTDGFTQSASVAATNGFGPARAVPEPSALALLAGAMMLLGGVARRSAA